MSGRWFARIVTLGLALTLAAALVQFGSGWLDGRIGAYVGAHPELVANALDQLRLQDQAAAAKRKSDLLTQNAGALLQDPHSAVAGNPQGDVTLVEFFDYKCPYCRQFHPQVPALLAADPGLRLVLKEFPVLGPESTVAARAAVAAQLHYPARYLAFHNALMTTPGRLDVKTVLQVAADAGINAEFLSIDMMDPEVDRVLAANHALADMLGIEGTPGFIIGTAVIPGYIDSAEVLRLAAAVRKPSAEPVTQ